MKESMIRQTLFMAGILSASCSSSSDEPNAAGNTIGGGADTGGGATSPGGMGAGLGGTGPGGTGTSTGGMGTSTGGMGTSTGGMGTSTGGTGTSTGGTGTSTGGTGTSTGGMGTSTGGMGTSTGGIGPGPGPGTTPGCDMSELVAFPCAEGYGKVTTGGRGGSVCEVTNLNSSGPGSLKDCASKSNTTVVFRVAGTIEGGLSVADNVTIAGQTAPGDGIAIQGTLTVRSSNVIVRYIRVRGTGNGDVITGGYLQEKLIFDHVSASWSSDEVFSLYWEYDMTIQYSIVAEAASANHKFGGIWGGERNSYHHNLFAHNTDRNPRISSGAGHNDLRNNVIYNWSNESIYGCERIQTNDDKKTSSDGCWTNVVNNYLKPGPGTPKDIERSARICSPWVQAGGPKNYGKWYVAGNYVHGNPEVTADNWKGVFPFDRDGGIKNDQASIPLLKLDTPTEFMPINEQTAEEAYKTVLEHAGCSKPNRDSLDARIVEEVRTGTAVNGNGFVASPTTPPKLAEGTPKTDADHDGMADDWEMANGLDPSNAEDRNQTWGPGYTMLEKYINSLDSFPDSE